MPPTAARGGRILPMPVSPEPYQRSVGTRSPRRVTRAQPTATSRHGPHGPRPCRPHGPGWPATPAATPSLPDGAPPAANSGPSSPTLPPWAWSPGPATCLPPTPSFTQSAASWPCACRLQQPPPEPRARGAAVRLRPRSLSRPAPRPAPPWSRPHAGPPAPSSGEAVAAARRLGGGGSGRSRPWRLAGLGDGGGLAARRRRGAAPPPAAHSASQRGSPRGLPGTGRRRPASCPVPPPPVRPHARYDNPFLHAVGGQLAVRLPPAAAAP